METKLDRHGILYRKVHETSDLSDTYIDEDGVSSEPRPYLSGYFIIRVTKVRGPRSSGSEFRGEHAPLLDTDDSGATGKYLRVRAASLLLQQQPPATTVSTQRARAATTAKVCLMQERARKTTTNHAAVSNAL